MREIRIVGDHNNSKPFMVVEYFRDNKNTKYVGHKILKRFVTKEEANKFKFALKQKSEVEDERLGR